MKRQLDAAEKTFADFLAASRLRKTPERFEILRMAFSMKAHFGAEDLHRALEESGYHVSRATVYNTIEILMRCGLMHRHIFETHQACYEIAGTNHLHLVCTSCGRVAEADIRQMDALMETVDFGGFRPDCFSTTIYGICHECAAGHTPPGAGEETGRE